MKYIILLLVDSALISIFTLILWDSIGKDITIFSVIYRTVAFSTTGILFRIVNEQKKFARISEARKNIIFIISLFSTLLILGRIVLGG